MLFKQKIYDTVIASDCCSPNSGSGDLIHLLLSLGLQISMLLRLIYSNEFILDFNLNLSICFIRQSVINYTSFVEKIPNLEEM